MDKVKEKKEEVGVKKITEKDYHKKENKVLIVLGFVFAALAIITTSVVVLLPKLTSSKDLVVPDVSDKTVDEAVDILTKMGLKISAENKTITSDTIEKGKVVKTSPNKGRTVKEGSEVVIYESSGAGTITLEDYTGKKIILKLKQFLEQINKLFVIQKN
ncbi:MAG: PASTA domain-containing protein [Clostridium sp.]|nr:MAG: PASTA domain-containing protein [Clostridium sp.]